MAKLSAPIFSAHANGALGALVYQGLKGGATRTGAKQIPSQPHTWPQKYQRWLYTDYSYLWHTLTPAQKQVWTTAGVRLHLPGYQTFMRDRLTSLPDLAGAWHLDEESGAIASDWSRNGNHGAITGTTVQPGRLNLARSFAGGTDKIIIPDNPTLQLETWTIEIWLWPDSPNLGAWIASKQDAATPGGYGCYWWGTVDRVAVDSPGQVPAEITSDPVFTDSQTWVHLAITHTATGDTAWYRNGLPAGTGSILTPVNSVPLYISGRPPGPSNGPWTGRIDEPRIYNRVLSASEIARHAGFE